MGEGSVIASAGISNVRSGRLRRDAMLFAAAVPLFLIAMWVRTPALPRAAGPREGRGDRLGAAEAANRAMARALSDTRARLEEKASRALTAPRDEVDAFQFLSMRS